MPTPVVRRIEPVTGTRTLRPLPELREIGEGVRGSRREQEKGADRRGEGHERKEECRRKSGAPGQKSTGVA